MMRLVIVLREFKRFLEISMNIDGSSEYCKNGLKNANFEIKIILPNNVKAQTMTFFVLCKNIWTLFNSISCLLGQLLIKWVIGHWEIWNPMIKKILKLKCHMNTSLNLSVWRNFQINRIFLWVGHFSGTSICNIHI